MEHSVSLGSVRATYYCCLAVIRALPAGSIPLAEGFAKRESAWRRAAHAWPGRLSQDGVHASVAAAPYGERTWNCAIWASRACGCRWSGSAATISASGSTSKARRAVIHKALDAGITLFDTADIYGGRGGSETVMGQILGDRRKDIVLASKFGMAMDDGEKKGASRRYIMAAVEASLKRLKTDWLDLYQVHQPDPLTPIEETLRALDDLVRAGKVRYVGCSNYSAAQMIEAQWAARHLNLNAFISARTNTACSSATSTAENLGVMQRYGLGLLPLLPARLRPAHRQAQARCRGERHAARDGAVRRQVHDRREFRHRREARSLREGARPHDDWSSRSPGSPRARPVASIIAGATKPEQIEANVKATGWTLTRGGYGGDRQAHGAVRPRPTTPSRSCGRANTARRRAARSRTGSGPRTADIRSRARPSRSPAACG